MNDMNDLIDQKKVSRHSSISSSVIRASASGECQISSSRQICCSSALARRVRCSTSPMASWSVKISPHSSATPRPPSSKRFLAIPPRAAFMPLLPRPKGVAASGRRRALSCAAAAASTAMDNKAVSHDRLLVFVPPHPLIKHWVSVLRNEETPCAIFKSAMAELGRLLIYEASRDWLPTISGEIQTPMDVASVEFIDPREPVLLVPILRAGLALVEHASSILPATKTYHLGLRRDESTLQPSIYLNNLPDKFPEGCRVFVVDPMLATGGTIVAAIDLLKDRGVENKQIKIISAVAAPPALQKLNDKFPGVHVYTGIIDPVVNEKGFIVPGLGDAGDRSFNT